VKNQTVQGQALPAPVREHTVTLQDRQRLSLTGVTRIISCDETAAVLETSQGNLSVTGQGLQVSELSVSTGQVYLSGKVQTLHYSENSQTTGGLLARLLH